MQEQINNSTLNASLKKITIRQLKIQVNNLFLLILFLTKNLVCYTTKTRTQIIKKSISVTNIAKSC